MAPAHAIVATLGKQSHIHAKAMDQRLRDNLTVHFAGLCRHFGHDRDHTRPVPPLPADAEGLRRSIVCLCVRAGPGTDGGLSPNSTSPHCAV
jgi:hypothetical protein